MTGGTMKPASGITTRGYKSGSIIYFEGDKSEYIFILKQGRVILTSNKIEQGEIVETKEEIKPGEFFGVKSSLGKYPRDETAQTFGDTIVLVLTLADFETLVLKNVNVVKKMLRVFSNQLRKIGKINREILGEGGATNPEVELFKIGEHYYKVGRYKQALYAYKRYMEYYPNTQYSDMAMKRINAIQSGSTDSDVQTDFEVETAVSEPAVDEEAFADFTLDEGDEQKTSLDDEFDLGGGGVESSLSSEMDDFLSDDSSDTLDDFSFDESPDADNGALDVSTTYYDAVNLFSQGNFSEALSLFEKILQVKTLKDNAERNLFEKTHFEIGRCQIKMGQYDEALKSLSSMIKKFPQSEYVKITLFHIGLAYEMLKNSDKAVTYYNKVASIEPKDQINKQALKRISVLKNKENM